MPGVFGGLASALFSTLFHHANSKLIVHGAAKQPIYQLLGLGITLAAAIVGGLTAGLAVKYVDMAKQTLAEDELFEDAVFWAEVEEHED